MKSPKLLRSPFPHFGNKDRIAALVWTALGDPANFVEPLCGSAAVLRARPSRPGVETINDIDPFICNLYRALRADPDAVADLADYPVIETDLVARHLWLLARREELLGALEADPEHYDVKAAAWWVWGAGCWIGQGWCDGRGQRQLPDLDGNGGKGVHGQSAPELRVWFRGLRDRLRTVRVACGDWRRVVAPTVIRAQGGSMGGKSRLRAVFLDPPYAEGSVRYASGGGRGGVGRRAGMVRRARPGRQPPYRARGPRRGARCPARAGVDVGLMEREGRLLHGRGAP